MSTDAPATESAQLPVDPSTGRPLPPRAQPGYYPGFSTLSQQSFWDEATRTVVIRRVEDVPPIRFFSAEEATLMTALADRLIPQDDRDEAHRIPVVNWVDQRLYDNISDGYRFDDMPSDQDAFHLGLQGVDAIAREMHGKPFVECAVGEQDVVLWTMHDGKATAGDEIWEQVPVTRFWLLLLQDVIEGYYAHPYAWDEIGFGGPAYPRGYFRLERGQPEPWEVSERRYEWAAPPESTSDQYKKLGGPRKHRAPAGQEGSH